MGIPADDDTEIDCGTRHGSVLQAIRAPGKFLEFLFIIIQLPELRGRQDDTTADINALFLSRGSGVPFTLLEIYKYEISWTLSRK